MSLPYFSVLMFLVAVYGVQIMYETSMSRRLDAAQAEQARIQAAASYFQQVDSFMDQVMRRMAKDSLSDPGLSELLKKYKIKVVVLAPGAVSGTSSVPAAAENANASAARDTPVAPESATPARP